MNQLNNLKKQINDANKTLQLTAPILEQTNPELKYVVKGVNLAQQNLVPMIDQTNKAIQKGQEIQQQCIEKVQSVANTQIQKANEVIQNGQSMLQSTLKENKNLIAGTAGAILATTLTQQINQQPEVNQQAQANQKVQVNQQTQVNQQLQIIQPKNRQSLQPSVKSVTKEFETPTQGGPQQEEKSTPQQIKQVEQNNYIQTKIKQYIKKVTGKQVNSRIEYLCLLSQKLKDNNDINYQQHTKDSLKNEMWKGAYQERRIQSHQMFVQYMSKVSEFIFEYLTIIETVFQQTKMRYKSSNNSFEMLLNYCKQLSVQLDYYVTYGFVQQNQSFLSRLFTNQAKIQKIKQNRETKIPEIQQMFHQELCQDLTKLETEYRNQIKDINALQILLKEELREKIILIQQRDQQRMSDYLMQLQGQRNITFEAIESFYRIFLSYETLYNTNVEAAFNGEQVIKDLYDEEYKMYYYLRNILKQQQQFGVFTTYMLKEISEFEYLRIEFVQKTFIQLNTELGKFFQYPKIVDFTNPNILVQAKNAFDINQLLNNEQLAIIKKYAVIPQDQNINTEIYSSFAGGFTVPMPLFNESPLILKKYYIERDVAWERSLSFGEDFIKTQFIITVDGFLLFYDTDWKDQNLEEPIQCHNCMAIKELIIKETQKDDRILKLIVTKQGKLFNSQKKQILRMNDQMEKESLKLLLTQFK